MRFRAILFAPHTLLAFTQALGKVGKEIVMVFDTKEVRFMTRSSQLTTAENLSDPFEKSNNSRGDFDMLVAYGGTDAKNMFDDIVCQSVNANQIAISLRADALERALKARVASREHCIVKLTKNRISHLPMLEISSVFGEHQVSRARMTQQLNVKLIAAEEWKKALIEPALGPPEVYIAAPTPFVELKHVLHKLAPHGDHIELSINMSHTLKMSVESEVASVAACWRGMEHPTYVGDKQQQQQQQQQATLDENENDDENRIGHSSARPNKNSKAASVFDLEIDADATENATFTRVYVNKTVLNKLLGSTEMFCEGGRARVIL